MYFYGKCALIGLTLIGLVCLKFQCERKWNYSFGYETMVRETVKQMVEPLEQRIKQLENEKK